MKAIDDYGSVSYEEYCQ